MTSTRLTKKSKANPRHKSHRNMSIACMDNDDGDEDHDDDNDDETTPTTTMTMPTTRTTNTHKHGYDAISSAPSGGKNSIVHYRGHTF